jgi:hypothetical protein
MKIKLPSFLTNKIIEIQRWNYRRKLNAGKKTDAKNQLRAINKAEKLSKIEKQRLWVVRVSPGNYIIRTKADVKAILRSIGLKGQIDIFSVNDSVVHITK